MKAFLRLMEDFPNYYEELKMIAEERQLRIAEALRKIKQLLPIASTSKFWEKKRQHSLYDLDDVQRISDFVVEGQFDPDKAYSLKNAIRFSTQQARKGAGKQKNSLGGKIDEEENEDDDEEIRAGIPKQILEDKDANGKIAKLINAQELHEEENKLAKWITQMQNSRASPNENRLIVDSQLTQTQLQTKLQQAEGDSKKKKAVLIVKGTSNMQKSAMMHDNIKSSTVINAGANIASSTIALGKRNSNSFSADKSFHSNTSNSPIQDGDKKTLNRRSYFFRRSQNFESVTPVRRSHTFKVNKVAPKPNKTSLFNKIFDSQKTAENKKKKVDSKVPDVGFGEKIDILEIPTRVIQNFTKNAARSNSLEKPRNNFKGETLDIQTQVFKIKSTPNVMISAHGNRLGEAQLAKLENSINIDPNYYDYDSNEDQKNGTETKEHKYEETPKKVLMVRGSAFEKRSLSNNTVTSLTSNEEDEIPDIAMCLVNAEELNKNFRLNIYDAPRAKFTEKALSNFLGGNLNENQNGLDTMNEAYRRRREDQGDYKINVIAPKSASKLEDSGLAGKDKSSIETSNEGDTSNNDETPHADRRESGNNILRPSFSLQRANSIEVARPVPEQKINLKSLLSQFSLKTKNPNPIIILPNNPDQNKTDNKVVRLEPTIHFLKPPQLERSNNNLEPKTEQLRIPLGGSSFIGKGDQSSPRMSLLTADLKSPKIIESFPGQEINFGNVENLQRIDQREFSVSIMMSENPDAQEYAGGELSKRRDYNLKVETPRDFNWRNLTPPPAVTDLSWKRSQTAPDKDNGLDFEEEVSKLSEKKIETEKSLIKDVEKNKGTKRTKVNPSKYKQKYKKQKKYIKELLSGFKDLRKDYSSMQKDVVSIQSRIDILEGLIGNLQNLMSRFSSKVKADKKEKLRRSPSIERTIQNNAPSSNSEAGTIVLQKNSQATSTIYLPQKKTIVFSFQKPEAKTSKLIKEMDSEAEKSPIKDFPSSLKDSSLFFNENDLPVSPIKHEEEKWRPSEPDILSKPSVRRVPKVKGSNLKGGFEIMPTDQVYASDEESDKFINKRPEEKGSKIP